MVIRTERPAAVRSFLPGEAKPLQGFEHGRDEFQVEALGVHVFVAEHERASVFESALLGDPEGSGVAEV